MPFAQPRHDPSSSLITCSISFVIFESLQLLHSSCHIAVSWLYQPAEMALFCGGCFSGAAQHAAALWPHQSLLKFKHLPLY
jgi:hypothetical protein